jgi:shikimate dehydrogenase
VTRIQATSRILAVFGDPISHSLSPVMHNAAISALGLDAVYVALRATPADLPTVLGACKPLGVSGNLTVPLKRAGASCCEELSETAQVLGAVNTFVVQEGTLLGDNTDVTGVLQALDALGAESPWLVRGTGGAARAVAAAALEREATLMVQSRDPTRADHFVSWAVGIGASALVDDGRRVGTAINATPLGLRPDDPTPISADRLDVSCAVLDLVYAPGETGWVRGCRARGMSAQDGRMMLVSQGAAAFERFFPGARAPREIMAAAVRRALLE